MTNDSLFVGSSSITFSKLGGVSGTSGAALIVNYRLQFSIYSSAVVLGRVRRFLQCCGAD
uniref:Uncharacterized protein n=1 Tax=Physcomitrium patens TaxID=3218 RepID=A0A2K1KM58_PHYPA|nr:hypothetical protein PHYPA_005750 [Physcomitrium patens]